MERKFESELGKDIAAGRRSKPSLKLGVVTAAVASCAMLVCLAGISMAMGGSVDKGGPPFMTEKIVFDKEVDELAWQDCDAAVKRVMSLKYKSVLPDGSYDVPFTKFNYVMNFAFNQTVTLQGIAVGELSLEFTSDELLGEDESLDLSGVSATITMTVTGTNYLADGETAVVSDTIETTYTMDGNTIVWTVVIPSDLEWTSYAGDTLSVQVTILVSEHVLHGDAVETPWVRYQELGLFEDHIGVF